MNETKKTPTTAELLARAREVMRRHSAECIEKNGPLRDDPCDCGAGDGLATLSELERRMGAMEMALRGTVKWMREDGGAKTDGEPCRHPGGCKWQRAEGALLAAESALTDAPAVFTLEEVRTAGDDVAEDVEPGPVVLTDDAAEAYASGWARGARTVADRLTALRR